MKLWDNFIRKRDKKNMIITQKYKITSNVSWERYLVNIERSKKQEDC